MVVFRGVNSLDFFKVRPWSTQINTMCLSFSKWPTWQAAVNFLVTHEYKGKSGHTKLTLVCYFQESVFTHFADRRRTNIWPQRFLICFFVFGCLVLVLRNTAQKGGPNLEKDDADPPGWGPCHREWLSLAADPFFSGGIRPANIDEKRGYSGTIGVLLSTAGIDGQGLQDQMSRPRRYPEGQSRYHSTYTSADWSNPDGESFFNLFQPP